ncbi:GSCOCG00009597001-RA-CDS [Cotesia congregata]|nr:GSCOCG00009597001-RA-CDS [Cotesia congregata]
MIFVWLIIITGTIAIENGNCARNQTILETSGDAILTVFIDLFQGQSCNETSPKGFQELTTTLYITSTLNKIDFTPGISLGLKIIDTCQDSSIAAREALLSSIDCPEYYSLGLLVPLHYQEILSPLASFAELPVTYYSSFLTPKVSIALDFLTRSFPEVDLLLTDSISTLDLFMNQSQNILPPGSFILAPETRILQPADSESEEDQIRIPVPMITSLGQPLVGIAELLSSLKGPNCSESCTLPAFDAKLVPSVPSSKVLELLGIESQRTKWTVFQKTESEETLKQILSYEVDDSAQIRPLKGKSRPRNQTKVICEDSGQAATCSCINKPRIRTTEPPTAGNYEVFVLIDAWCIIFLVFAAFGALLCLCVALFVGYRFIADEFMDGNPVLTLVLIVGTVSMLGSVVVFCLVDNEDQEVLNKWKIFSTTVSTGFVFSLMLARSFFLAFSTKGVFSSHINGYLQAVMAFFVNAVQLAISTVFFLVNDSRSQDVLISYQFVALSGYNIFLLLALLIMSLLIFHNPRNYREGRCFLFTSLGLLGVWSIWILVFVIVPPRWRETIVALSLIASSYTLISGLILKVFYILTHLERQNDIRSPFENAEFRSEPRRRSFRQSRRPFHDYVLPMEGVGNQARLQAEPNYYGNSSPADRNSRAGGICGHSSQRQDTPDRQGNLKAGSAIGFNNYGFSDMHETENHYVVPRVCVQNPHAKKKGVKVEVNYAQPTYEGHSYHDNLPRGHPPHFDSDNNDDGTETEIYVEGKRLSPSRKSPNEAYPSRCSSPRLYQTEATINEEDETNADAARVTRF